MATITGKAGRKYRRVAPNTECEVCHKTAGELGCKTVLSFGIHRGRHVLNKQAKWRRRGDTRTLVPIGAVAEAQKGPMRVGDIRGTVDQAIDAAVLDINKAVALVQLAAILPKVPTSRVQKIIADLTRRYDK